MVLRLRPLFAGEIERMPLDVSLDCSELTFHGGSPLPRPVRLKGEMVERAGMVFMEAQTSCEFEGLCDRCLSPVRAPMTVPIRHVVVASSDGEETDDVVVAPNDELSLEPLIEEDLYLAFPQKVLCTPDCKGLCPRCGKNLNDGPCGCREETGDPRMAALASLLRPDGE